MPAGVGYADNVVDLRAQDEDTGHTTPAQRWVAKVEKAERDIRPWRDRCEKIVKIYTEQKKSRGGGIRQFSLLWANTEVLKPAVYARPPQPVVTRRFRDKDPIGRQVSELMERALTTQFEVSDMDAAMREARDDFVLVARGTVWVRYEAQFDDQGDPDRITSERVAFDHVHWSDFIYPMRRKWVDMPWVARRVHMEDDEFARRFGKEKLDKIKEASDAREGRTTGFGTNTENQGRPETTPVYEIWSKTKRKVYWVAKGCEEFLDEQDPFLNLQGFFPCPPPAFGTRSTNSLIPTPDYMYYQDQAEEINDLTQKIAMLTDSLKLVGFYPAGLKGEGSQAIEMALSPDSKSTMVPVPGYQEFQARGGATGLIDWVPLDVVVAAIQAAIETRRQILDDVYQLTGISDIIRGDSDPRETLGAQQLKSQWGGIRIRDRQAELQRFARDITRIAAEIIAENFQPETLMEMTGLQVTPDVMQMMRSDRMRTYRVEIETDSTLEPDEAQEKQSRNDFLEVVAQFMERAFPLAQSRPEMVPMLGEMLLFNVRAYRIGRQMEQTIEEALEMLNQAAQQAAMQPPEVPPEIQIEQARQQAKLQSEQMAGQLKLIEMEAANENDTRKAEQDAALKLSIAEGELLHKRQVAQEELRLKQDELAAEMALKQIQADRDYELEQRKLLQDAQIEQQKLQMQEVASSDGDNSQMATDLLERLTVVLNAPREIVRDDAGNITGSRLNLEQDDDLLPAEVMNAINAPREVVRDETGRIVGSRIMQTSESA